MNISGRLSFKGSAVRVVLGLLLAGVAARGQEHGSGAAERVGEQGVASAPVRYARLTFLAGAVQIQRSDNTGEESPVLNMPIGEGTRVVAGDYGQAEIEFEDGSVVRLTPRSSLSVDTLALDGAGSASTRMTLLGGMAYFELRKAAGISYAVQAGGTSLTPVENTTVRVKLGEGPAVFAVLTGAVRVERAEGFRTQVRAGESLRGDAQDESRYFLNSQFEEESWDRWSEARDQLAADEAGRRTAARDGYAGTQGYGWSDLDANGSWYQVAGQGQVWQPAVADENFDPYGYGNWVWSGVGYAWASGYSWGWTPFRCGQWAFFPGFGWGWVASPACGRWGLDGGELLLGAQLPPHYAPAPLPLRGPGGVHPIIAVHGPNGPRPPVLPGGVRRIAGKMAEPLPQVGVALPRDGSAVGQALNRDFPVDMRTHRPVFGVVAAAGNTPGAVLGRSRAGDSTWRAVQTRPGEPGGQAAEHAAGERARAHPVRGLADRNVVPAGVVTGPAGASAVPGRPPVHAEPVRAEPVPRMVVPAPAPVMPRQPVEPVRVQTPAGPVHAPDAGQTSPGGRAPARGAGDPGKPN